MSMNTNDNKTQGHWLLAKLGKKVLRPGGKALTLRLIEELRIKSIDDVVEFAPGLGFTASITIQSKPKSYTAVELNKDAVAYLQDVIQGDNCRVIQGNASNTNLPDEYATKVYGEAMLTMQSAKQKSDIVREANRILKKGGLYGIHEIALTGDLNEDKINAIYSDLTNAIKTNAKPITVEDWKSLLVSEGFMVRHIVYSPMHLVEPKRIIADEGFFRALRIFFNILTHPSAAKRVKEMKRIFRKYEKNITAVAIIAEKI